MRSFPLLWRSRSWAVLSLLSFFALSLPCAAQYPGGGSGGGGYPGGASWQVRPCDAGGTALPSPTYDQDGFLSLTGTQTGTATNTYPQVMRDAARRDPAHYGWYLAFSPSDETQFPYTPEAVPAIIYSGFQQHGVGLPVTATSCSDGGNYALNAYGNAVGTYAVPDASGNMVTGPINGGITTTTTSVPQTAGAPATVNAYFKWFYVDGNNQPLTPPPGDTGPPDQMFLLLHTRVSAGYSVDYGTSQQTSGLTATASASDGLGDSLSTPAPVVTPAHPYDSSSQTLNTPFLLQPTPGSGIAAVSLAANTSTSFSDSLPFGVYGPYPGYPGTSGYYQVTNGKTLAFANASVTGRVKSITPFQCHSTVDSALWDPRKPRFFSGTNCSVVGTGQVVTSYVQQAVLLIGGTPVKFYFDSGFYGPYPPGSTFGTNQTSASLTAFFDSTHFPDGSAIPIQMTTTDMTGKIYTVNVSGPACNNVLAIANQTNSWIDVYTNQNVAENAAVGAVQGTSDQPNYQPYPGVVSRNSELG